jgi:HlyD family secretion protein
MTQRRWSFRNRWLAGGLALVLVGGLLALALWPTPVPVSLARIDRGPMAVHVSDEGRTRVIDLYTVAAPVSGDLDRITLEPGDAVAAGHTPVARIHPGDPPFLDPRAEAVARAMVAAARAAVDFAQAEVDRAVAERDLAARELARARALAERGNVSQARLDQAEAALRRAEAQVAATRAALRLRQEELRRAEAELTQPDAPARRQAGCCVTVTAPVSGDVLEVVRESAGPVNAGDPLVRIGRNDALEVVVELLSTDAVKVEPGAPAEIVGWGGDTALPARVRRVEPSAFTEVSALGIEEQRVNVVLDFADPDAAGERLGHGYRVQARISIWQQDAVTRVPVGALFRDARGGWAVYRAVDGRARLTSVAIGRTNDSLAQVESGLEPGDAVILYPGDQVADGARIAGDSPAEASQPAQNR